MKHNHTAYLLVRLAIIDGKPVFDTVRITSQDVGTMCVRFQKEAYSKLLEASGETLEKATSSVITLAARFHPWVIPILILSGVDIEPSMLPSE